MQEGLLLAVQVGVVTGCSLPAHTQLVAASHALALLVAFSCYWLGSLSSVTLDVHPSPVGCIHVGALEMLGTQKGTKLPQNS